MAHLGRRISAIVDGRLSSSQLEQARAHLDTCRRCRDRLAEATRQRQLLRSPAPAPSRDLIESLLELSTSSADDKDSSPPPAPAANAPWRRSWPQRLVAIGSLAALAITSLGGLYLVGSHPRLAPEPVAATFVEPAQVRQLSDAIPARYPATVRAQDERALSWLDAHGWQIPSTLPPQMHIATVHPRTGPVEQVEIVVQTGSGQVSVVEQPGRLDPRSMGEYRRGQVAGREVYRDAGSPGRLAWQCHGMTISVTSTASGPDTAALIGSFPAGGLDDSVPARLERGWTIVSMAVAHH